MKESRRGVLALGGKNKQRKKAEDRGKRGTLVGGRATSETVSSGGGCPK